MTPVLIRTWNVQQHGIVGGSYDDTVRRRRIGGGGRRRRRQRKCRRLAIEIYGGGLSDDDGGGDDHEQDGDETTSESKMKNIGKGTTRTHSPRGLLLTRSMNERRNVVDFLKETHLRDDDFVYLTICKKRRGRWIGFVRRRPRRYDRNNSSETADDGEDTENRKNSLMSRIRRITTQKMNDVGVSVQPGTGSESSEFSMDDDSSSISSSCSSSSSASASFSSSAPSSVIDQQIGPNQDRRVTDESKKRPGCNKIPVMGTAAAATTDKMKDFLKDVLDATTGGNNHDSENHRDHHRHTHDSGEPIDNDDDDDDEWMEAYRVRLEEVIESTESQIHGRVWKTTLGIGSARQRRKFVFETESQARDFYEQFTALRTLVGKRSKQRLEAYQQRRSEQLEASRDALAQAAITKLLSVSVSSSTHTSTSQSSPVATRTPTDPTEQKPLPSPNRISITRSFNDPDITRPVTTSSVLQRWYQNSIHVDKSRPADTSSVISSKMEDVNLLVEIVSAMDLPIADRSSTDPYVVVYLGQQIIHKTKAIPNDLNPVWTVDTRSLFLVSCTAEDFFGHVAGLTFHVVDQDPVSKGAVVAHVSVPHTKLLQMDGERESFRLDVTPAFKKKKKNLGRYYKPKLHLRVRSADQDDLQFMKLLTSIRCSKKEGVHADHCFIAPQKERVGLLRRETKVVDGVTLHRVKPGPDPNREEKATKWLSKQRIEEETMKPSRRWIEAGTGSLGRMFVEVLKCDEIPNMDVQIPGRPEKGLSDAFCCLIFEDAIVSTDVIRDDLNPRWVPWSQRAFVFNITHPSSLLHIGVFDYDLGVRGVRSHDPIGRISVDITNLRPNTEYKLTYRLYESTLKNERQSNGTLTIRLVFEYDSFRKYALAGVTRLPPMNHINVARKNDFKMAHFVCNGDEDVHQFSMDDLTAHRTELESLVGVFYYIRKAILAVIFWRGQKPVKVFGLRQPVLVPLHSIVAFVLGTTLVENFNFLPSYCLFSVAWLLMATNDERQKNPSPWHGSMTFMQMWYALILDQAAPEEISDYENEALVRAYEQERKRRQEEEEINAKIRRDAVQRLAELMDGGSKGQLQTTGTVGDDFATKLHSGPTINPLAVALLPIQTAVRRICRAIRVAKSIIMWDESYIAFSIVNVCLLAGVAILWIPWHKLLRWTVRVIVWIALGPWMKLVDLYVLPNLIGTGDGDDDDKDEALRRFAISKMEEFGRAREALLKKKEVVMKYRAMKRYMFGRYATKVPRFKEFRYRDVPLPESSASPIRDYSNRTVVMSKRSHGQTLMGDMIPTWGDAIDDTEGLTQHTRELLPSSSETGGLDRTEPNT